ncbi:hypothetical protein A3B42_03820 [Candidatus Daviesbacteria bacterium RIFCSPLOWO2_01_FULL_38_10]|nr:MAG: hypothetical protein A3B42_03820 [Candidatus Daviesbacteria bacterium RIFCSPLOWO2_01_FULL_38_10]OGE73499.1 MAG: hypothetical protein A3H18_05770 [Candidatus Daviesbacteria bacterium RIFCSPLOWO2_12_FULL_38_10]
MAELEQGFTRDYSFQQHEVVAGLLIGPYLIRYLGREGSDLFFRLSVFDHSNRYFEQQPVIKKLHLSETLRLFQDGVEFLIKPKEACSEVDLDVHTRGEKEVAGEDSSVIPLKDVLLTGLNEVPLMMAMPFKKSNRVETFDRLDKAVLHLSRKDDLESSFPPIPTWLNPILGLASETTRLAFEDQDQIALLAVHRSLKTLYDLHLFPNAPGSLNQHNPFVGFVRRIIEDGWMAFEEQRIKVDIEDMPKNKKRFASYFQDMVMSHPATSNRLYEFLQHKATKDHVTKFLLTEYPLNVRFFDIIVLSALGTDDGVRREVSENLWDESGTGMEDKAHTRLYQNLLNTIGVDHREEDLADQLDWQALAGYNLFLNLGLHRNNYYRFVGCLGATELLDPPNYTKFMAGCRRLGLDQTGDFTYYIEHIDVDIKHGSGWVNNVMMPLLDTDEDAAYQFLLGANMRLNIPN